MELDARTAVDGTTLSADVCIVGAGPVGLTLAHELQGFGLQVLLIESGGFAPDTDVQELNAGDTIGDPYPDLRLSRSRGIGGTASIWNTMVGGAVFAKYAPLDDIDFRQRDWIPWSGWPFERSTLDPYYHRAHTVCGLGPFDYRAATWSDDRHPLLGMIGGGLTTGVFQYGPADRFRAALPAALLASSSVTVVHGATVTELLRSTSGERIREARWASFSGRHGVARASHFVLAAGGIENTRLLLLYLRTKGNHLGPDSWIGRGFMEHPIDASLELISRTSALTATPGFYSPHTTDRTPAVMGRLALSPELLQESKLPNASVRLIEEEEPRLLQAAGPKATARRLVPFPAVRRLIGTIIRRGATAQSHFRGTRYRLLIDLEQCPHPDNRLQLSDRRDHFGQQQVALHWRWRREDQANRERIVSAVARELQRAGLGRLHVMADRPLDPNAHHHAGTTRMHPDPTLGVVDETLRVQGEENLFVVGSSVFPTAGVANPTLTAIALALRLADHLADCPEKNDAE